MGHQLFIDFPLPKETCWQEETSCRSQTSLAAFFGLGLPVLSSNEKRRRCYSSPWPAPRGLVCSGEILLLLLCLCLL